MNCGLIVENLVESLVEMTFPKCTKALPKNSASFLNASDQVGVYLSSDVKRGEIDGIESNLSVSLS